MINKILTLSLKVKVYSENENEYILVDWDIIKIIRTLKYQDKIELFLA